MESTYIENRFFNDDSRSTSQILQDVLEDVDFEVFKLMKETVDSDSLLCYSSFTKHGEFGCLIMDGMHKHDPPRFEKIVNLEVEEKLLMQEAKWNVQKSKIIQIWSEIGEFYKQHANLRFTPVENMMLPVELDKIRAVAEAYDGFMFMRSTNDPDYVRNELREIFNNVYFTHLEVQNG